MLHINYIRENTKLVLEGLKKRHLTDADELILNIINSDKERRLKQVKRDESVAWVKQMSAQIGGLIKEGKKEEAEKLKLSVSQKKDGINLLEEAVKSEELKLQDLLYAIPNIPDASVPQGKGTDDNLVVFEAGSSPQLPPDATPHWDLIKKYNIIDFDLGNKISGAGFPVYIGKGAKLQRALIQFFLDEASKQGYLEIQPPILVNEASAFGTGQLPDKEGQMYHINDDNLYAIPTAEVPLTNIYRDEILSEDSLPVKLVGYTPCFRREAGSWGSHVRGLNRLHQFDKVEIVHITKPEDSYQTLEEMSSYVQSLIEKLNLPYRKLLLCSGDLGFNSSKTFDMEVYATAQQRWLEVSSVSNFESFQSNRLRLRYKNKEGKVQLLHTLNGSALALPRIVASILENNQTPKGITIPKALIPYTKFDIID